MFMNCETVRTSIGIENEVLLECIKNNLKGNIPIKYKATEGRLIKTKGKIYNDIRISLFGFNDINITSQLIQFNVYLISLEKILFEFPQQIIIETSLLKNTRLRRVQMTNNNISCFIHNESNETKVKYLCEIPGDTTGIKNIKIKEPGFNNFNVKLTPLASGCMNNLKHENNHCNKELNNLNEIYILQNAICEKKEIH